MNPDIYNYKNMACFYCPCNDENQPIVANF